MSTLTSLDSITGAVDGGEPFDLRTVLRLGKAIGGLDLLRPALQALVIRNEAAARGITVQDADIQAAADEVRRSLDLTTRDATLAWLAETGRTLDDFDVLAELAALRTALRDEVISDADVEADLEAAAAADVAIVARIVTHTAADIDAAGRRLRDDKVDFFALADEVSIEPAVGDPPSRSRLVRRSDLTPDVAEAVFGASTGTIVGPFDHADRSELIRVDLAWPTTHTDTERAGRREELLTAWLDARVAEIDLGFLHEI